MQALLERWHLLYDVQMDAIEFVFVHPSNVAAPTWPNVIAGNLHAWGWDPQVHIRTVSFNRIQCDHSPLATASSSSPSDAFGLGASRCLYLASKEKICFHFRLIHNVLYALQYASPTAFVQYLKRLDKSCMLVQQLKIFFHLKAFANFSSIFFSRYSDHFMPVVEECRNTNNN